MEIRIRKLIEEPGEELMEEGHLNVNSVGVAVKREDISAFSSRLLRIDTNGHTALHSHEREHIAVVLKGRCRIETGVDEYYVEEGNIITIPKDVPHRFINPFQERLALLIMNFYKDVSGDKEPELNTK